ncbi:hypothetical protein GGI20_003096 [Coemansia sp. BCRC 34301]|nr:hypothetical protein GGI20_003096 [Coemansia sp. BCRC 34301]
MNGQSGSVSYEPQPVDSDDSFFDDRNQVSIVATLCGDEPCSSTSRRRSWWSGNYSRTRSRTATPTSDFQGLFAPTPPPLGPLYDPSEQIFGQQRWDSSSSLSSRSASDSSSDNSNSGGNSSSMKSVVSSAVSVVVFLAVAALIYRCIRKRRKARGPGEGALHLNSEASSGGSSLPATPLSLSGAGGVYLGRSFSSQSSVSLVQSRLTTPSSTPHSLANVPLVEMSQVRFADHHSFSSTGFDDGRPAAPMAAVTRPRPPPPPPPPLPPRVFPRERADTFSDIPQDDLPPYVDPIEEAMSAGSEADASAAPAPSQQPCPPPYHVVDMSVPATPR